MEFRVLGTFDVVCDGASVALGPDKQRALLALLVLRCNTLVPAAQLVEELWDGRPPPQSASSLYAYVSRLRRLLEGSGTAIVGRRPGYELQVDPDRIDSRRFERLVAEARRARSVDDLAGAAQLLDEALALWRGLPLADMEWLATSPEVVRLAELRLDAMEEWADAVLALGHHVEAVARLEPEVARAPFREGLRGRLMLSLYRSGRQADALRCYRSGHVLLVEELGLDPGPDLQRLEGDILRQAPALDARPLRQRPPGTPGMSVPFVGRSRELEALRGSLAGSLSGATHLAVLDGEAGIGKTRLAEELADAAIRSGARVFWGRCQEVGGAPPFWPWTRALRDLEIAELEPGRDEDRSALAGADRTMLLHAIADRVGQAAAERPLVLVLDDVQWADAASLRLLEVVAREVTDAKLLLVVTLRRTDIDADHPLATTLAAMAGTRRTVHVGLTGLTEEEVAELLDRLGCQGRAGLAPALRDRTDGNPFFLHEIVGLLVSTGRLTGADEHDLEAIGVPVAVGDVIRARLGSLPPAVADLLHEASVAGRHFDLDALDALRGDGAGEHLHLLDLARHAGLVSEVEGQLGCFRFIHALVQQALYEELSDVARATLHERLADGLALRHGTDPARAAVLARHLVEAVRRGARGEVERKAILQSVRAGEWALTRLGYEEAATRFTDALEVADGGSRTTAGERSRLLIALGGARWRSGDVPRAQAAFIEAASEARAAGEVELLGEAVVGIGGGPYRSWHAARGDLSEIVVDHLVRALDGITDDDSPVRVRLLGCLAESLYYVDPARRRSLSAGALAMARRLGDPIALAGALSSRLLCVWDPGGLDERLELCSEIRELAVRIGDRQLALFGHRHGVVALLEAGRTDAAAAMLDAFAALAEEVRQPLHLWEALWLRAAIVLLRGHFDEAEALATAALHRGQGTLDGDALGIYGAQLALIRSEQGRLEEMAEAIRSFAEDFSDIAAWRVGWVSTLAELGRHAEARTELDALAAEGFADLPDDFVQLGALAMLARICSEVDDRPRAALVYNRLAPFAGRNVLTADRHCWGAADRYLGLLAGVLGELDDAVDHLEAAVERNRGMGALGWWAHSQADLALVLRRRGRVEDRGRSAALLADARRTAEALGMAPLPRSAGPSVVPPAGPGHGRPAAGRPA